MSVYKSKYSCKASLPKSTNPLPRFRDENPDFKVNVSDDISKLYTQNLGKNCGRRVFPYSMQDNYSRDLESTEIDSIVLENNILKATFLPTLGGRLISLYDKELKRELLYDSKYIQACNLSSRDAWFSGGIEFNVGQYGHSLLTMDNVFAATVVDLQGNEFLRIGEYEKMHGIYYHIDFHLPPDSHFLFIKCEVSNFDDETKPFYVWINTALVQTENTRVFSSSRDALFLNPFVDSSVKSYSKITLPDIPDFKSMDASYPSRFPFSNEYFFTCKKDSIPYEVTIEKDGSGFIDFSTNDLNARKMFCWGMQNGGQRWQSYLNGPNEANYFEAQAGMAPTQLHGEYIASKSIKSFTQVMGAISSNSKYSQSEDYSVANSCIKKAAKEIFNTIDIEEVDKKLSEYCNIKSTKILNYGSSFGYLNSKFKSIELNPCYDFLVNTNNKGEGIFESMIDSTYKYSIDDFDNYIFPPLDYYTLLDKFNTPYTNYLKALILIENYELEKALSILKDIVNEGVEHSLVLRAIAQLYYRRDDLESYHKYYYLSLNQCEKYDEFIAICSEYSYILRSKEQFEKAKTLLFDINTLLHNNFNVKDTINIIEISDSIALDAAVIAAKFGDLDTLKYCLFNRELACIREGDNPFLYLFNEYKTLELAKEKNIQVDDELRNYVRDNISIPTDLDFTMTITHKYNNC